MLRIFFTCLSICSLLFFACKGNTTDNTTKKMADEAMASDDEKEFTGTFTVDGKSYKGRVSTQQFPATGQFSVLCQDKDTDPNSSMLLQFVFKNETVTRAGGDFITAYDQGKKQAENEVSVSADLVYQSHEDSKGTFKITKNGSSNTLDFDQVTVSNMDKTRKVVSGKIQF